MISLTMFGPTVDQADQFRPPVSTAYFRKTRMPMLVAATTTFNMTAIPGATLAQTSDQLLSGTSAAPAGTGTAGGAPSTGAPAGLPVPAQAPGGGMGILLLPLFLLGIMIMFQVFAGRKEKRKRQALLDALKKHDKVLTIGGILGTVAELRDEEVVLRVDENTNTKIRVTRASIQQILTISDASPATSAPTVEVKTKSGEKVPA